MTVELGHFALILALVIAISTNCAMAAGVAARIQSCQPRSAPTSGTLI